MRAQGGLEPVIAWARRETVPTPALLFVSAALRAGVARLREALGGRISYAMKANPHPLALRELLPLVDEFNVTNLSHLDALLERGVEPQRILFAHPVLTRALATAAVERGVTRFVLDCPRGLELLRSVTRSALITLRLLPPDAGESALSVIRFGNSESALRDLARDVVDAGFRVEALSFFIGTSASGMEQAAPFSLGLEGLAALRERLALDGIEVPIVNIGGGFPGARRIFHRNHPDFFRRIRSSLAKHFGPDVEFVSEPGRFLSEPSMAILARVVRDRVVAGRRLVYLDVSSYAGLFETCFIEPGGAGLTIELEGERPDRTAAVVVGPIMDSFDVVKREAELPALEEGELVLLPNIGAYAWGYTTESEGVALPAVLEPPESIGRQLADAWYAA